MKEHHGIDDDQSPKSICKDLLWGFRIVKYLKTFLYGLYDLGGWILISVSCDISIYVCRHGYVGWMCAKKSSIAKIG